MFFLKKYWKYILFSHSAALYMRAEHTGSSSTLIKRQRKAGIITLDNTQWSIYSSMLSLTLVNK